MSGPRIWVLFHVEVHLLPRDCAVDEMPLYAASSRPAAERLIRRIHVDPGTWWRLVSTRVDDIDGMGPGSTLYSRRGRVLKSAPVKQGYRAAIRRYRRDLERARTLLAQGRREGRPKREIRNLAEAARSIRAVLIGHGR